MQEGLKLFERKNHDYDNSFFDEQDNLDAYMNIKRKFARIDAMFKKNEKLMVDETIEDTLLDLGNYCFMTIAKMRMQKDETRDN